MRRQEPEPQRLMGVDASGMADPHESDPIRVIVCDDHFLIREGLKVVIGRESDIEVVGEARSAETAISLVEDLLPDVAIMDVVLPGMSGIEATRAIKASFPSVAVVVLTRYDDVEHIMEIYRAGASAYLMKDVEAEELLVTIRTVSSGRIVLHDRVANEVIRSFSNAFTAAATAREVAGGLSARELEVLSLVAQSKSNKEIARELSISVRTAQNHLANIFRKLEINDRISAALFAVNEGLAPGPTSGGRPG